MGLSSAKPDGGQGWRPCSMKREGDQKQAPSRFGAVLDLVVSIRNSSSSWVRQQRRQPFASGTTTSSSRDAELCGLFQNVRAISAVRSGRSHWFFDRGDVGPPTAGMVSARALSTEQCLDDGMRLSNENASRQVRIVMLGSFEKSDTMRTMGVQGINSRPLASAMGEMRMRALWAHSHFCDRE